MNGYSHSSPSHSPELRAIDTPSLRQQRISSTPVASPRVQLASAVHIAHYDVSRLAAAREIAVSAAVSQVTSKKQLLAGRQQPSPVELRRYCTPEVALIRDSPSPETTLNAVELFSNAEYTNLVARETRLHLQRKAREQRQSDARAAKLHTRMLLADERKLQALEAQNRKQKIQEKSMPFKRVAVERYKQHLAQEVRAQTQHARQWRLQQICCQCLCDC